MASVQSTPTQSTADLPIIVKDRRRHGFYTVDNIVLDRFGKEMKPTGIAVYNGLARYTNREGECWPSQATLADLVGMSRMQVSREIEKLKRLSLIDVQPQYGPNGGQRANLYILLNVPKEEEPVTHRYALCNTQLHPPVTDSDTPHHRQLHKQNTENKTKTEQNTEEQQQARDSQEVPLAVSDAQPDVVVASTPTLVQQAFDDIPQNAAKEETAQEQSSLSVKESPTPLDPPAPDSTNVGALLVAGIAPKVAQRLASRYSGARIEEKLDYLDFLQDEQPDKVQNPCGWLRRAIEEDYAAPDGYKSSTERAAEAADAQRQRAALQYVAEVQRQQKEEEQDRRRQEEAARLAELHTTYGTTQQEIDLWNQLLPEFKLSMPVATFLAYVADTLLLSLKDGEALIGSPNQCACDWLETHFVNKIERTVSSYLRQKVAVKLITLAE